jgi:hypothetical protein
VEEIMETTIKMELVPNPDEFMDSIAIYILEDKYPVVQNEIYTKKIYKILRKILGPDQIIVVLSDQINFLNKYYSHVFSNVMALDDHIFKEDLMKDYRTRLCLCEFNNRTKVNPIDFYTIPKILDLLQSPQNLEKDIKEFLERSPYA